MVSQPEPKKAVALIQEAFIEEGARLKTKLAYELLAKLWGYRDWATYCGMNPKDGGASAPAPEPFGRPQAAFVDWPSWVVYSNAGNDDELFILPFGATLENRLGGRRSWQLINDDDGVPFTVGFTDPEGTRESWQDLVVAVDVACQFPRADRYGFPPMANDREVADWLENELGWGFAVSAHGDSIVVVHAHDTGDDSATSWWVEVKVHPTVHERLLTQFTA